LKIFNGRNCVLVYAIAFAVFLGWKVYGDESLASLFMTPTQRGQMALNEKDYLTAAALYQDPLLIGIAHYLNEDFPAAVESFKQINTEEGLFNFANALAHTSNYVPALAAYDRLLKHNPEHPHAIKNREIIRNLIESIQKMNEGQAQSADDSEPKDEGGPKTAEGVDEIVKEKKALKQLTAEEILNDPEISDAWMRQIQSDPANFLKVKFNSQYRGDLSEK